MLSIGTASLTEHRNPPELWSREKDSGGETQKGLAVAMDSRGWVVGENARKLMVGNIGVE